MTKFDQFKNQIETGLELCNFVDQINQCLRSFLTNVFATCLMESACSLYIASSLILFHNHVRYDQTKQWFRFEHVFEYGYIRYAQSATCFFGSTLFSKNISPILDSIMPKLFFQSLSDFLFRLTVCNM
jgi:hypothetical protein